MLDQTKQHYRDHLDLLYDRKGEFLDNVNNEYH